MFASSFLLLSTLLKGLVETSVKSEGRVMPRSKRGDSQGPRWKSSILAHDPLPAKGLLVLFQMRKVRFRSRAQSHAASDSELGQSPRVHSLGQRPFEVPLLYSHISLLSPYLCPFINGGHVQLIWRKGTPWDAPFGLWGSPAHTQPSGFFLCVLV